MRNAYFRFMSAIDIDCYRSISESDICSELPYSDILQLFIINHQEKMTISELASRLNLSRPATTQKVNELVKKGLVIKSTSSNDKRITYLTLTDKLKDSSKDTKASNLMTVVENKFSKDKLAIVSEVLEYMSDYLDGKEL